MLTNEQRANRKKGVGASDSPIIMGFSSYKTPYMLYLEKLGLVSDDEETEIQYWGHQLEAVICDHFAKINNLHISVPDTYYHPNKEYMFANLDGFIEEQNAVVEIKNSSAFMRQEWGESGTDAIPMQYLIQVAHQCIVTNADKGFLAVLIGGNEYRQFIYERDKELETMIVDAVDKFWLDNVTKQVPPESITIKDSRLKYNNSFPNLMISANDVCNRQLTLLVNAKTHKKIAEEEESLAKMKIMEYMKHAECLTDSTGKPLVTLKPDNKGTRRFLLK